MRPLYNKHMDDIITGHFSSTMMADWANDDVTYWVGVPKPLKQP